MAMSKKDYEAVASMISAVREDWKHDAVEGAMAQLVSALSGLFAADNQRFDRVRFAEAAGGGLQ